MKRLSSRLGTVLMVLLAAASHARADYMNWTYTTNIYTSPTSNIPVSGISVGATSPIGGATVALANYTKPQAGASSIPVLAYIASTSSTTPITFGSSTNSPSTYTLALQITDKTSGDSKTFDFTGSLAGPLTFNSSGVINSFVPLSNSLTLDGYKYTVTIPSVTLAAPNALGPIPPITALVSVSPGSGPTGGGTSGTPEPTSLLLGSLGFSFVGVGCWWKRRSALRRQPSQG